MAKNGERRARHGQPADPSRPRARERAGGPPRIRASPRRALSSTASARVQDGQPVPPPRSSTAPGRRKAPAAPGWRGRAGRGAGPAARPAPGARAGRRSAPPRAAWAQRRGARPRRVDVDRDDPAALRAGGDVPGRAGRLDDPLPRGLQRRGVAGDVVARRRGQLAAGARPGRGVIERGRRFGRRRRRGRGRRPPRRSSRRGPRPRAGAGEPRPPSRRARVAPSTSPASSTRTSTIRAPTTGRGALAAGAVAPPAPRTNCSYSASLSPAKPHRRLVQAGPPPTVTPGRPSHIRADALGPFAAVGCVRRKVGESGTSVFSPRTPGRGRQGGSCRSRAARASRHRRPRARARCIARPGDRSTLTRGVRQGGGSSPSGRASGGRGGPPAGRPCPGLT